jgi:hypothetical protein
MNPFDKYLGPEDILGGQCAKWLFVQYPKLLWWHTPNEGRRTPFERYRADLLGIKRGVSDILIMEARNGSNGLIIELKAGRNKCTPEQLDFLEKMKQRNYSTAVVYKFEDFQQIVNDYMKQK